MGPHKHPFPSSRRFTRPPIPHHPPASPPQGELDLHKGEANRLRREMERVEGERERLREEARK